MSVSTSPFALVNDITPQLGGELDAQTVKIINVVDPTVDQGVATKKYVDDTAGGGGALIDSVFTDVDVVSTTTETNLIQISVPAATLGTNGGIIAKMFLGRFTLSSTKTATLRLKYGTTTIATAIITNNTGTFVGTCLGYIDCMLIGAGGTSAQDGSIQVLTTTPVSQLVGSATGQPAMMCGANFGTAAEDSTGALNFTVTIQFNNSSTNDRLDMEHAILYKIVS